MDACLHKYIIIPVNKENETSLHKSISLISKNPKLLPVLIPLIEKEPELLPIITMALLPSIVPVLEMSPSLIPALTTALVPILSKAFVKNEKKYTIVCNNQGMIENISDDMLLLLKYTKNTILGQFIGIIMSKYMSMLHKQFFINKFNNCCPIDRNKLENKIKNNLKLGNCKRPIIIYDIDGKSNIVGLSIIYNKCPFINIEPHILEKQFFLIFEIITEPIGLFYTHTPMVADLIFQESKQKVIIICIDFINSTELLTTNGGILLSINNSVKFHKKIVKLIRNKYYPFIYLHEVIGDSFIIALNTDWAYNSEIFCTSLAINFIFDLVQTTRYFVKIRTGISYGMIHYGTIGSTFRFFGESINMASRLENKCEVDEIIICSSAYTKLIEEMEYIGAVIEIDKIIKNNNYLKGFGNVNCYTVIIPEKGEFILYNI